MNPTPALHTQTYYWFQDDFANRPKPEQRTGRFVGTAVLDTKSDPKILHVLAVINGENQHIQLPVFVPEHDKHISPGFPYFMFNGDEFHCRTDVRIFDENKKVLFLSPTSWSIKCHISVYDPTVEFLTINKAIFSPKE